MSDKTYPLNTTYPINTTMKQKISVTIDERVLKKLDKQREMVSRSRFVEEILKKHLGVTC